MIESLMGGLTTLVAFLVMLGVLVFVHELGHFLTAVWLGIKVEEFGLGYPPRAAVLFERNGVKYTLNWLPIGGFVRFGNEADSIYGVGSLSAAKPWRKIAVLFAGPLMNLLFAGIIFAGLFAVQGVPTIYNGARVGDVYENTPASRAGFQKDDLIISIAGQPVERNVSVLIDVAEANPGRPIEAVVERNGQQVALTVTPGPWKHGEDERKVGFGFGYAPNMEMIQVGLPTAIVAGFAHTFEVLSMFLDGLSTMVMSLFGAAEAPPGGVTGVVGMARGTGEIIENTGLVGFLRWTALISLNLFLLNLLPIPALDGSHILFSLIEMARRGKKIPPEREAMVHAVGFMVLMGLMLLVTISDVANWIRGVPVFGS